MNNKNSEILIISDKLVNAEIIISASAPRLVNLAASEFQSHVKKITGKELPIHTQHTSKYPVKIYIGKSIYTQQLKLQSEYKEESFQIKSGKNWLALVGDDKDFVPQPPFSLRRSDQPVVRAAWQKQTNSNWSSPRENLFKFYNKELKIWQMDKGGSLNAVYELLRSWGVEWYLPNQEIGEVIPQQKEIPLPSVDSIYYPVFPIRKFAFYSKSFHQISKEETLWQMRLGINTGHELLGLNGIGHGVKYILEDSKIKQQYPELFALYDNKRDTKSRRYGRPCLSSKELREQTVKYAQAIFNIYDDPMINIMPPDSYIKLCECNLCNGKGSVHRGFKGQISDYVWEYVNDIAKELHISHPNKKVVCFAYGAYQLPPENITKLSPNIVVGITRRRSDLVEKEKVDYFEELQEDWEKLSGNKLIFWDYYLHARPGKKYANIPVVMPHIISEDIKKQKNKSYGEMIEIYRNSGRESQLSDLAINHLNIYITSRLYWNPDADVDLLLDNYYQNFYGEAADKMKDFFTVSEKNWHIIHTKAEVSDKLLNTIEEAITIVSKNPNQAIYRKRIELIYNFVKPLANLKNVKKTKINIRVPLRKGEPRNGDNTLNEAFWKKSRAYNLKSSNELYKTSVQVARNKRFLIFNIKAVNPLLNKKQTFEVLKNEDLKLILRSVENRVYILYFDIDGLKKIDFSEATSKNLYTIIKNNTKSYIKKGVWEIEVYIPFNFSDKRQEDKINETREPSELLPWSFNVYRRTTLNNAVLYSSLISDKKVDFNSSENFVNLYFK